MRRSMLALFALVAGGCGAAPDPTPEPMPDLAMSSPDLAPAYPLGPYGSGEGDRLPDLTFNGYFSPTAVTGTAKDPPRTFGAVTMRMLHHSGARFAILMLAGFW